ncbi:MAG: hypothetical protein ABSA01_13595 [Anaerolineales bacterium]|jgi:hypothetical protein
MKCTLISLALFLILASPFPVLAQTTNPPVVDPNSMWGEVVDQSGNIRYSNLTDLGTVQQSANWMPSIPGIGSLPASYHEYQTPSGNIVVLPTATTLFFMALNPQGSGLAQADSQLGLGSGVALEVPGIIKGMLQNYITPDVIKSLGYVSSDDFFTDVINGKQDIWSVLGPNTVDFLTDLAKQSLSGTSFYTMLLLYTPGDCSRIPGGCPQNARVPSPPSLPPSCSTTSLKSGAITVAAKKLAPLNPLVVGQDTARRGVDVTWEVTVEPTIYTFGISVPVTTNTCVPWSSGAGVPNCKTSSGKIGVLHASTTNVCQQRTQIFPEALKWATPSASLSQKSRDWIFNTLSLLYPEPYLHHPNFSFAGNPAAGSFQGNTFVWDFTQTRIQVADPGHFDLGVAGATTGTPVSSWRGFSKTGGQFPVYLEEAVIIQ